MTTERPAGLREARDRIADMTHSGTVWTGDPLLNRKDVLAVLDAALAAAEPTPARCVCGAMPPSRPWTSDDPCRDGNGNFNPGHRYAAEPATGLDVETQRPVVRYVNHSGAMVPDAEGQWVHVADLQAKGWKLDPVARLAGSEEAE